MKREKGAGEQRKGKGKGKGARKRRERSSLEGEGKGREGVGQGKGKGKVLRWSWSKMASTHSNREAVDEPTPTFNARISTFKWSFQTKGASFCSDRS